MGLTTRHNFKFLILNIVALSLVACTGAFAETFITNARLKYPTTSPNLELHECDTNVSGCTDTYSNVQWMGPDGNINTFLSAHEWKGGEPPVAHDHYMERFSCGTDESDITSCGRIETNIDTDFPTREFRNMNLYINPASGYGDGAIFMESPDGNVWKLTISNAGALVITDENPPAQPITQ